MRAGALDAAGAPACSRRRSTPTPQVYDLTLSESFLLCVRRKPAASRRSVAAVRGSEIMRILRFRETKKFVNISGFRLSELTN